MNVRLMKLGFAVTFVFMCVLPLQADKLEAQTPAKFVTQPVFSDNGIPWGMAWLPNGEMLVSMRGAELKLIKNGHAKTIKGLPDIAVGGQGGLLDIIVHPNYENNGWIYFSYTKANSQNNKNTAIMRARLKGTQLVEQQSIYQAQAYNSGGRHFGSRLAFDDKGYLYFSIGDRGQRDINPQSLQRDAGKVYRLHDDGRIPEDNPFTKNGTSKSAIYSYGHRNPQGMAKHPVTGDIWIHEHGPKGGDEVNIIAKGKNYGWPVVSFGVNYSGSQFTKLTEQKGMTQPTWQWTPSIAPSGMVFVTSDVYPNLKGSLLVGSLKFGQVIQLLLEGDRIIGQKIIKDDLMRVRNISQGPDGYIYIAIDGRGIVKLTTQ